MKTTVVIPFRLREGADPRRAANLEVVQAWWYGHGFDPEIVDDGLSGDAQFNRHRAYNRAVERFPETDVFVFAEADMLVHPDQIRLAVQQAWIKTGLVVPFTQYRYLSDSATETLRMLYHDLPVDMTAEVWGLPADHHSSLFAWEPESVVDDGESIGAINVVSRDTLDITGGFTEATTGNWYDDNITEEGFAYLTGSPTRFVKGPAVHLYHLSGHTGEHLSDADVEATTRNKNLLVQMRTDILLSDADAVRYLMAVRT